MSDPLAALGLALARIAHTEFDVCAWVRVDESGAREQAADVAIDAPLAGAIAGIKDIFDVAGMATLCGLRGDDRPAASDATAVARLRAAGAVILGKTQTTPYAWLDPAPTCNPHDRDRTPGGSSAGSAAAVAAGQCTIALGSQTVASTLRPASFCGVVGFKPTFDRIATDGITPLASSLDHVGIFARHVADVTASARVLDPSLDIDPFGKPMRRFVVNDLAGDVDAEPCTRDALARAVEALKASGNTVHSVRLPDSVRRGSELITTVLAYESFATHGERWRALGHDLPPRLRQLLQLGATTSTAAYEAALTEREDLRPAIARIFDGEAALVTPCALGEAPDRATTGDGRYVRPWTFFGVPAIAIPAITGPHGLPVGVQIVGAMGTDAALLATAELLEIAIATSRSYGS